MTEYIKREAAINAFEYADYDVVEKYGDDGFSFDTVERIIRNVPAADVVPVPEGGIGEMSDGHHTFNSLYYQRMVLFAALVKVYKGMAWKSWRHEDGELCFGKDNYFIVGIDTPQGSYTYHYHGEHWDLFDCEELPVAKHWDGHTEKDVTRLLSLDVARVRHGRWIRREGYDYENNVILGACSKCGWRVKDFFNYCPNCGALMDMAVT